MTTINKLKNAWINTDTSLSGTYQTCSLLNNGASEFAGNVIVDNKLAINKAVDGANNYKLDVSGNTCLSDLIIKNKNTLSQVQYINGTTTLTFGSGEYLAITSTCATNSVITLPTVTSVNQIGTKFTFFFNSDSYPTVNIYGATNQSIVDNIYSFSNSFVTISYSRSFVELVCTNYTTNGVCWSLSNGANDYSLMPGILSPNNWGNLNTFDSQLPTSTLTTFNNNNQFVTKYFTDLTYLKSADASTNYLKLTDASLNYLKLTDASLNYLKKTDASINYLKIIDASTTYATKTYADGLITSLKSSANTWTNGNTFNSSTFINNSSTLKIIIGSTLLGDVGSTATFKGSISLDGTTSISGNTNILSGTTFTANSGSVVNINSSGYWNVPTGSSFNLQYNGTTWLELSPNALYSPISFSPNFNQTTFNGYIVFKTGFTIENGQTIGIGTSYYGYGYIQVAGNGSYINIQNSGGFFSNWIEPTSTTSSASWYTTHASTLTFGNSGATLTNNFSNNTFTNITFTGTLNTISATTLSYISTLSSNAQTQLNSKVSVFSPTIYTPTFTMTAPFIPVGDIISTFTNDAGDSIKIRDNGFGLTSNAMCIDTANSNGLSLNSTNNGINFHIAKTLIAQVLSTGLSVTGNLSFTGSLGSITQSIFSNIATAFGKQTPSSSGSVITAATTLSPPFSQVYSVFNGATAFTITIPQASASNAGVILCFRRASSSTSTTVVSLTTTGSTQSIYNGVNSGSTTFSMLASGVYIIRFVSITNGTTYGWHQV